MVAWLFNWTKKQVWDPDINIFIIKDALAPSYCVHARYNVGLERVELTHLPLAPHIYVSELGRTGDKPLPEAMLTYYQLDPWQQTSVKFKSKYKSFHSWKCIWRCHLQNGGHFVQWEMSEHWVLHQYSICKWSHNWYWQTYGFRRPRRWGLKDVNPFQENEALVYYCCHGYCIDTDEIRSSILNDFGFCVI